MNRFWIPLGIFAVLCVVFGVALKRAPDKQFVASALIGKPAPEFKLPDLLKPGATVDSSSYKGRWVLVNAWGTWCVECQRENSTLLDIKQQGKVVVIGLNFNDTEDAARQWLDKLGNPFDVIAVDREGRVAIDFGVYGAPESFLVNPQGIIVHKVVGGVTADAWRSTMLPMIEGRKT
jgi:cytochrome c biogenesis protein CcmG/thiol:disulfide interchange protein DsbE